MLSASHRRAATVRLTFEFPFYGHLLRNITIATGGFLFTGDFVHTWLAATQYIAPLMANFDTSMSKNASVKYADNVRPVKNGSIRPPHPCSPHRHIVPVQWNNVPLKDHADAGTFTFQVTLHKNGDIVFTYKQVPMFVTAIVDDQHPVKVGLSDAYIVDRTIFFVRRKTIYEYHKIDMKKRNMIGNWTAILFKALPTCVSMHTCTDCLSQKISSFQEIRRMIGSSIEPSESSVSEWSESSDDSSRSPSWKVGMLLEAVESLLQHEKLLVAFPADCSAHAPVLPTLVQGGPGMWVGPDWTGLNRSRLPRKNSDRPGLAQSRPGQSDRCSNGLDRNRQAWLHNSCETRHVQLTDHCPPPGGDDGPPNPRQPLHPDTFGHDASVESFTADRSVKSCRLSSTTPGNISDSVTHENTSVRVVAAWRKHA
ncbi:Plexin domain-containing protein 2 [Chionoecetes opilio]|uniref:Plexin domain-containing protein 2 n=1 Tax=Chionoecetes opilio TaxID=41210 RepID=A0A8J5CNJ3_CHIOP|nr:Plexin domain-containing protein 2 [Chionoecetes opilio]